MIKPLTTHIGSLPFLEIEQALDFTFKFDLPVLFTLPKLRSDDYIAAQIKNIFGTHSLDIPYEDEFLLRLKSRGDNKFKYQLVGPYTAFELREDKSITFDQTLSLFLTLYNGLAVKWKNFEVLLMLDEPLLINADRSQAQKAVLFARSLHFSQMAIHCCSKLEVSLINELSGNFMFHIDTSLYDQSELDEISVSYLPGLSYDLQTKINDFPRIKGVPLYLSPSCGLALEDLSEIDNIHQGINRAKHSFKPIV